MEGIIYASSDRVGSLEGNEYSSNLVTHFNSVPDVAKPLISRAKSTFQHIEKMLYSAPTFINAIKASIPQESIQAILTDEQKQQLAQGALKLMTKKDGTLMANLVNPETNKIVSTIALEKIKVAPELSQAMASYATQMQMAQIAEQMQTVQIAVEEVRQGQEYDRLSSAYSCQQKLIQATAIRNPELKNMALLRLVADAEDSRNLLMQSQNANVAFIKDQPESFWGKLISGATPEKIDARMAELRESLCAVNMVSLVEALAYQELGEPEVAQISLQYYANYIEQTYLLTPGFVNRLDMIDPSPENYWSKTLPEIERKIQALPCNTSRTQIGANGNESEYL